MHTIPSDENRIANAVALIKRARAKGDGFGGFDAALKAVKRHPTSLALAYHVTLQAARIGALSQASRLFTAYNIAGRLAAGESDTNVSMEDLLSLSARIEKDRALEELGPERSARLKQAANGYLAVFDRSVLRACCPVERFRERVRQVRLRFAGHPATRRQGITTLFARWATSITEGNP